MFKIWILYYSEENGEQAKVIYANASKSRVEAEKVVRENLDSSLVGKLYIIKGVEEGLESWGITLPFGDKTTNYRMINSSNWQCITTFQFPGISSGAEIDKMLVFAWLNKSNKTGYLRLYDVTNDNTIAEVQFDGNTNVEMQSDLSLQNVPDNEAIMEIQAKTSNGAQFKVQSVEIR